MLVAGDLMLDRYWRGDVDRISPEAPVPVVRKTGSFAVPGGAANTACNVAALGAHVTLFGVCGDDEAGTELRSILSGRGIACRYVLAQRHRPTTVKLRIVAHDQQIVRIDEEDTSPVGPDLAGEIVRRAAQAMRRVDAVLISDYAKGFAVESVVTGIVAAAGRLGKPVVIDPKGSDFGRYRGATVLKPNRSELAMLTGMPVHSHDQTVDAAHKLLRLAGVASIVITEGKDGMTLFQPDMPGAALPQLRPRRLRRDGRRRYGFGNPRRRHGLWSGNPRRGLVV